MTQREKNRETLIKINEAWLTERHPSWTPDKIREEAAWMQREAEAGDERFCTENDC